LRSCLLLLTLVLGGILAHLPGEAGEGQRLRLRRGREAAPPACTSTLSAGGNIASAISAATGGAVICLNDGAYSSITLGTYTKSPRVTIRAVNALGADVDGMTVASGIAPNGLTFDGITWTDNVSLDGNNQARNFTIQNCAVGTNQIDIRTNAYNENNVLVDNCTFGAFNESDGSEGRLAVRYSGGPGANPSGVTLTNNTFGPGGCSDGVEVGSNGVVVGPGNIFTGVAQGACSTHVDGFQGFGDIDTVYTGNYCDDSNTVCIGWYDDGDGMTVTNNVVSGVTSFRGLTNSTITHNTFDGATFRIEGKSGDPSGLTIQNNLFVDSGLNGSTTCSGCTISSNMFDGAAFIGSGNLTGTPPTFTGGASPATWAGYLLTALSVGKAGGNDGFDMGTLVYGQ
jgi:hypothetical protein